jgi:hypothetical protein
MGPTTRPNDASINNTRNHPRSQSGPAMKPVAISRHVCTLPIHEIVEEE